MEQTFHGMMAQCVQFSFQMGTWWLRQTFIEDTKWYLPGLNVNTVSRTGWLKGREDILSMVCTLKFECIWHLCSLTSWEKIRSLAFWYSSSLSSKDLLLICSFSRGILSYKIHQNTTIRVDNEWHTELTVGRGMPLSVGGQMLPIVWHITASRLKCVESVRGWQEREPSNWLLSQKHQEKKKRISQSKQR